MRRKLIALLVTTIVIGSGQPAMAAEAPADDMEQKMTVQVSEDTEEDVIAADEVSPSDIENDDAAAADTEVTAEEADTILEEDAAAEEDKEVIDEAADEIDETENGSSEEADEADLAKETEPASEAEAEEENSDLVPSEEDAYEEGQNTADTEEQQAPTAEMTEEEMLPEITVDTVEQEAPQEAADAVYGDYQYELVSGGVEITKYTGKEASVSVPQNLGGYNVLSIKTKAFAGNTNIKSVSFPETLISIKSGAFRNCTSLEKVVLPASLQTLGLSSFENTAISSITIPANVSDTGSAFKGCANLTSVTFASGMKTIPNNILDGCASVKSVSIPDSVTAIGHSAFKGTSITEFKGHDAITSIGASAFYNCRSLRTVVLPASLQTLSYSAFENTAISSITIPAKVKDTGSAFKGCANLTSVTFASGMTTIPSSILKGCTSVKSITIPGSVTKIESGAFNGCDYLEEVHFLGTMKQWMAVDKGNSNDPLSKAKVITLKDNTITAHSFVYSYSGKARTFNIGAKASAGTLSYTSNKSGVKVDSNGRVTIAAKFSGKAKINITASGNANYGSASKAVYVSVPTKTSVSNVKSKAAGKMTVKWKKNTSITGYQIQYSLKKSFKGKKTATISKKAKTGRTIKGLKKGKRYYVRIRTYKKIGGKKYYSAWSKVKSVKIKK